MTIEKSIGFIIRYQVINQGFGEPIYRWGLKTHDFGGKKYEGSS